MVLVGSHKLFELFQWRDFDRRSDRIPLRVRAWGLSWKFFSSGDCRGAVNAVRSRIGKLEYLVRKLDDRFQRHPRLSVNASIRRELLCMPFYERYGIFCFGVHSSGFELQGDFDLTFEPRREESEVTVCCVLHDALQTGDRIL